MTFKSILFSAFALSSNWTDPALPEPKADPVLAGKAHQYFRIQLRDRQTKEVIPGAELRTTNKILLTSDKNGWIAFYEPGLMQTKVYFSVTHPGWELAKDGFGNRGVGLDISEGGRAEILLDRTSGQTVSTNDTRHTKRLQGPVPGAKDMLAIRVVDAKTQRPVPAVRVKAEGGEEFWSDSQGYVAFHDPEWMGRDLRFDWYSHGYKEGSQIISAKPGTKQTIRIERENIAERLYRMTGAGTYRDSYMLGLAAPLDRPLINGLVMGSDTVNAAVYNGKVFWIWQDTDRVSYPLGNFNNTGAFAELPGKGNISQDLGVNRRYFVGDDGFSRPMTPGFEPTNLPTWMGSLVVVPNAQGQEKMFGQYGKPAHDMNMTARGWGVFDDASGAFQNAPHYAKAEYLPGDQLTPVGDPVKVRHHNGDYLYYGAMRVPANAESLLNIDSYEIFSPYEPKSRKLRRDAEGHLIYGWKRQAYPASVKDLEAQGVDRQDFLDELHFRDGQGKGVDCACGSLEKNWNKFRKRYIATVQQKFGTSFLGEAWYAEADTPLGPWNFAEKIVSHDNYTFYNLQQHPFFDQENGRLVYFEGTYTTFFTDAKPTPRFDYNQMMYRLDLSDPRLNLPVAVYADKAKLATKNDLDDGEAHLAAAFFALEKPAAGSKAMVWSAPDCNPRRRLRASDLGSPAFFLSKGESELYEYLDADGKAIYSTASEVPGYHRTESLGRVWNSLTRVKLPIRSHFGDLKAKAGPDQCLQGQDVRLDGRASYHRAGKILSYKWKVISAAGTREFDGAEQKIKLDPGVYWVELKVTGDDQDQSTDKMMIELN